MDKGKRFKLHMILMVGGILLFFSMLICLAILQDGYPALFEKVVVPLGTSTAVFAIIGVIMLLKYSSKVISNEIEYKVEVMINTTKDFYASQRPLLEKKQIMEQIRGQLTHDGFRINDNIMTSSGFPGFVASQSRFCQIFERLEKLIFVLDGKITRLSEVEELMDYAETYLERNSKRSSGNLSFHQIVLCVLQDEISPDIAQNIKKYYAFGSSAIITVIYETSTGKVFYMGGKDKTYSALTKVQKLIKKYIIGESLNR